MELFLIHQLAIRYVGAILGHYFNINSSIMIFAIAFPISVIAAVIWRKLSERMARQRK